LHLIFVDTVKSNAIVLVSNKTTVGIGSGQPSRLDSCQIAINKMKKFIKQMMML
jgi:phosphoribosylaminoimidazolecarboxamide formyltransferase/IMP cyclohydrolase